MSIPTSLSWRWNAISLCTPCSWFNDSQEFLGPEMWKSLGSQQPVAQVLCPSQRGAGLRRDTFCTLHSLGWLPGCSKQGRYYCLPIGHYIPWGQSPLSGLLHSRMLPGVGTGQDLSKGRKESSVHWAPAFSRVTLIAPVRQAHHPFYKCGKRLWKWSGKCWKRRLYLNWILQNDQNFHTQKALVPNFSRGPKMGFENHFEQSVYMI